MDWSGPGVGLQLGFIVMPDVHFTFLPTSGGHLSLSRAAWAWVRSDGGNVKQPFLRFSMPLFLSLYSLHPGTVIPHLVSLDLLKVFLCITGNSYTAILLMLPSCISMYFKTIVIYQHLQHLGDRQ